MAPYTAADGARLQAQLQGKAYDARTGTVGGEAPIDPDAAGSWWKLKPLLEAAAPSRLKRMHLAKDFPDGKVPDDVWIVPDGDVGIDVIAASMWKQLVEYEGRTRD